MWHNSYALESGLYSDDLWNLIEKAMKEERKQMVEEIESFIKENELVADEKRQWFAGYLAGLKRAEKIILN